MKIRRKFHRNRFIKKTPDATVDAELNISASSRKLDTNYTVFDDNALSMDDYYCFVDFQLLKNIVSALKCPECSGDGLLIDKLSLRMGFTHLFEIECQACQWRNSSYSKGSQQYELWKATHICSINHVKSSGAMESAGAVNMFKHSVDKNNMIYQYYLGDGDTSSFKSVLDSTHMQTFE